MAPPTHPKRKERNLGVVAVWVSLLFLDKEVRFFFFLSGVGVLGIPLFSWAEGEGRKRKEGENGTERPKHEFRTLVCSTRIDGGMPL